MLEKIISGGQTGADRAALDAALAENFPIGGYCPNGRLAEDGPLNPRYTLVEYGSGYIPRTRKNTEVSDATVVFYRSTLTGGSARTAEMCSAKNKPCITIDIVATTPAGAAQLLFDFCNQNSVAVLNVAGPRASGCSSMYPFVFEAVGGVIRLVRGVCG